MALPPGENRAMTLRRLSYVAHLNRHTPAPGAGGNANLDVFAEASQEFHQALHGEAIEPVAHEIRYVRLADAEQPGRAILGEAALFEDAVHLEGELDLEPALFRVRIAEVGEHIPASGLHVSPFLRHSDPRSPVQPSSAAAR